MNRASARPVETEVVDLEERGWLPRHCQGDEQAFEALFKAYGGFVMTFLWRYGVAEHSRDDLFQEVFLSVHRSADRYRPSQPLRPWLVTIVLNTVRNHRRGDARRTRFLSRLRAGGHDRQGHAPGAAQMLEHRTTVRWLESRIRQLPDRQREALVLSTTKGLSMKDIARVMGVPENTVKTNLRRARLALANDLGRREAPEDEHGQL